jgi:hypothetical protein
MNEADDASRQDSKERPLTRDGTWSYLVCKQAIFS